MKIAIVTPSYNEEDRISLFLKEILKTKYPIIVVDDGSTDSTLKKIEKFKRSKNLTILNHKVNLGKGAALKTGCDYVFGKGYEAVILMDSDRQHSVSDLDKFINKLEKGKYDVVLGSRNLSMGVPLDRYIGNKIASVFVSTLFGIYVSDLICGFRALTKSAYKKLRWESMGYGVETEVVVKIKKYNLSHCEVPVETIYYDSFKGVTITDAFGVLFNLIKWRITI